MTQNFAQQNIRMSFIVLFILFQLHTSAQQGTAEGFFTSEAQAVAMDDAILVSIKKYNATQQEINEASKSSANGLMNYLMAPFDAVDISLYGKEFESTLYCMDKEEKILWSKNLGYSNKSIPSPVRLYNNFIFAGEGLKDSDRVVLQKMDKKGKLVWQTKLDSLTNVNDIYVDSNRVSALVSFDVTTTTEVAKGSFLDKTHAVYFFVQLDIATGKLIKKEYQYMANYLSRLNFSHPQLNSDYSYLLSNQDSAIFLDVMHQKNATVVSADIISKGNKILKLLTGFESYHLLSHTGTTGNMNYVLAGEWMGQQKKYSTRLPVEYLPADRQFMSKTNGDSIVTFIDNQQHMAICYTDKVGNSTLYKKVESISAPLVTAGISFGKLYTVMVEGRQVPGSKGQLKIRYY